MIRLSIGRVFLPRVLVEHRGRGGKKHSRAKKIFTRASKSYKRKVRN